MIFSFWNGLTDARVFFGIDAFMKGKDRTRGFTYTVERIIMI